MKKALKSNGLIFLAVIASSITVGCSQQIVAPSDKYENDTDFLSQNYGHFAGGLLFSDVEYGLNVLWQASFRSRKVYKENIGFFVEGGLLILPNEDNTRTSSNICALPIVPFKGKIWVEFKGQHMEVLGIVHTHPDPYALQAPSGGSDFQFSHMGIHNYVIAVGDVYDAYWDNKGNEVFERIGSRHSYASIPFTHSLPRVYASNFKKER